MTNPLLATKLYIPRNHSYTISRSRLLRCLDTNLLSENGFARGVTLVSAPAGYGKTTLVIDWLRHCQFPTAWLSLDGGDNDPARFLAYLIIAIRRVQDNFGENIELMLKAAGPPPPDIILTALINEITAIPDAFVLVLDDYHTIHDASTHQLVAFLLEHKPPQMHVILITREDPLLPLARLRAQGQLTDIRQDDLRFSAQECQGFLQNALGIKFSQTEIEALERRTEGWITGLQLAAISLAKETDHQKFIRDFTGSSRYILDYLMEEVFNHQSPELQDFLLKTSILDRFSGPLCDAVVGKNGSQDMLEEGEHANLFISSLDHSREWYRYHRLFAELLRYRLRARVDIDENDLHDKASQWFEENNFVAEAIQHAITAQNWLCVARILSETHTEMLKRGEAVTLLRWFGALPEDVLRSDPQLCFDYAWPLLLTGHYDEATELLAHVEGIAREIPTFLGEIMTAQAYLARAQGDHARIVERSERARALLPQESVHSRCLVAINLGLAYWHLGDMEATEEVLGEAIETSRATSNYYALTTAIILQGRVLAVRGQLRAAAEKFQQADNDGGKLPINALTNLDLCALHYEWNQLEEAEPYLKKAFELSQRGQNEEFEVACWMMQSCLQLAQGNPDAAKKALTKAQALVVKGTIPPGTAARFEVAKLRLALAQDDASAIQKLRNMMVDDVDSHNFNRFTNLAKVRLMLAQNQRDRAHKYLAELTTKAEQKGWCYTLIAIRVHQALAVENREMAVYFLERALKLAQPEGFKRIFIDLGPALIPHLKEAARCGVKPAYVREILSTIQSEQGDETQVSSLAEPLSERELEVLRLVVAGLSNREIANDLVISLGTAKTHIHNIYGKLEVSSRAQAIARAREYELV